MTPKTVPSRRKLIGLLRPIAERYDHRLKWRAGRTVLSSTAFGGIARCLNLEILPKPAHFTYELKMPLSQLLDQIYPA